MMKTKPSSKPLRGAKPQGRIWPKMQSTAEMTARCGVARVIAKQIEARIIAFPEQEPADVLEGFARTLRTAPEPKKGDA